MLINDQCLKGLDFLNVKTILKLHNPSSPKSVLLYHMQTSYKHNPDSFFPAKDHIKKNCFIFSSISPGFKP